jgi:serine/threonine protein kinase
MDNPKKKKRIVMSLSDKEQLSKLNEFQKNIEIKGRNYYLRELISDKGKKSVVWKVSDDYNNLFALKLATFEDYVDRSFEEEMIKAAKVNGYNQFARIDAAIIKEFNFNRKKVKCVAFLEEWVDGIDLEQIENEKITIPFILSYIEKLCDVLSILKHLKLRHDDLHCGNVLIVKPKAGLLRESLEIKIVDLGSLKDYYLPLKPIKNGIDDTINFALHIKTLLNKLHFLNNGERRILSSKEYQFIDEAIKVLNSIVDHDKGRALTKAYIINQTFQNLHSKLFSIVPKSKMKLSDPFDYITAEQISNDELLIKLFASSCPWITDITSPNPVLLTGPRGCGKSMLFRRFSLKALLSVDDKLLDDIGIAGFYISCSADLSNRLSIISTKAQATTYKEEIIHYFNLILLKEIISTLKIIIERGDTFSRFGIDDNIQNEIFSFVANCLKITQERKLSLQGVKPIVHLLELIKYESNYSYTCLVKRTKIKDYTPFSFISDITRFLSEKVPFFNIKKIAFLIDDYSVHRIPDHVQSLLNMVIWDRQSSHIFKVSSEKYGTVRTMFNNTSADLSREYTEIDIGRIYINLSESSKELKRFSAEMLNHRLALSDYAGTAEILIGNSFYSEGSLGKQIFSGKDSNENFHGLDTISQVCSGDISTLLELYRQIFRDSEIKKDSVAPIIPSKQHSAITSASKNFLELTKTFHPYGLDMYRIVTHFGTLCKKILVEGKSQRDVKAGLIFPNETTRIEIEETEVPEELSDFNEKVYKELIRRAIFIELEPSRGRHTLGITNRLQLRRIYCPSFGLSLSKNTAIKWSQSMFKAFLNDPESVCEIEFSKWKKPESNQKDLFNGVF